MKKRKVSIKIRDLNALINEEISKVLQESGGLTWSALQNTTAGRWFNKYVVRRFQQRTFGGKSSDEMLNMAAQGEKGQIIGTGDSAFVISTQAQHATAARVSGYIDDLAKDALPVKTITTGAQRGTAQTGQVGTGERLIGKELIEAEVVKLAKEAQNRAKDSVLKSVHGSVKGPETRQILDDMFNVATKSKETAKTAAEKATSDAAAAVAKAKELVKVTDDQIVQGQLVRTKLLQAQDDALEILRQLKSVDDVGAQLKASEQLKTASEALLRQVDEFRKTWLAKGMTLPSDFAGFDKLALNDLVAAFKAAGLKDDMIKKLLPKNILEVPHAVAAADDIVILARNVNKATAKAAEAKKFEALYQQAMGRVEKLRSVADDFASKADELGKLRLQQGAAVEGAEKSALEAAEKFLKANDDLATSTEFVKNAAKAMDELGAPEMQILGQQILNAADEVAGIALARQKGASWAASLSDDAIIGNEGVKKAIAAVKKSFEAGGDLRFLPLFKQIESAGGRSAMDQIFINAVRNSLKKMQKAADEVFDAELKQFYKKSSSELDSIMKSAGLSLDDAAIGLTKTQGFKAGVGKGFRATTIGVKQTMDAVRGTWSAEGWRRAATLPFKEAVEQLAGPMMTRLPAAVDEPAALLIRRVLAGTGIALGGAAGAWTTYEVVTVSSSLLALYWTDKGSDANKAWKDYLWSKLEIFGFDPNASEEERKITAKAGAMIAEKIKEEGDTKNKKLANDVKEAAPAMKANFEKSAKAAVEKAQYTFEKIEDKNINLWGSMDDDPFYKKWYGKGYTKPITLPTARAIKIESKGTVQGFIYPHVLLLRNNKDASKYRLRLMYSSTLTAGGPSEDAKKIVSFKPSTTLEAVNGGLEENGLGITLTEDDFSYLKYKLSDGNTKLAWVN